MPATISSCLNSCGLCGRAYQLPGCRRAGTRKSRAPSGVRAGQRRRLDLDEVVRVEDVAGGLVDLAAQPERVVGAGAAQVEVAVLEPRLLPHVDVVADRERQRRRGAEHLDVGGDDLDRAGREVRVLVALLARGHLAGDLEAVLGAQLVGDRLVADHDLDDAAGLAEVDEGDAAVIATVGHPPGEGDGLADVLGAQGAGVMGADHCSVSLIRTCGRRSSVGGVQVAGSAATCSPDRMSLTSWPPSALVNQTYGMPRRSA